MQHAYIRQTIQRQQQSEGKPAHIPEQLMQSGQAMQQNADTSHSRKSNTKGIIIIIFIKTGVLLEGLREQVLFFFNCDLNEEYVCVKLRDKVSVLFVYTIQPCNMSRLFMQLSHIRRVRVCLAVTCYLHFWQNNKQLLHVTSVTRGWNGYRSKSQHKKLTPQKQT